MKANTTIRNNALFCLNCGGEFKLNMPIAVDKMTGKIDAFNILHADCKQTWVEPKADQSKSVQEKAMFWLNHGQTGMSSMTIWNCLMGTKDFAVNIPWDPGDFNRCYGLLEMVPEWIDRLPEVAKLSPEWSRLIDNWDKLVEMLLDQRKTKKANGMYEFMETLTRP